jgi:hypothetical protein
LSEKIPLKQKSKGVSLGYREWGGRKQRGSRRRNVLMTQVENMKVLRKEKYL